MEFSIVHQIRGRARLRALHDFGMETAVMLADGLETVPGVEGVRVNPRTGSVLLVYGEESALSRAMDYLGRAVALPGKKQVPIPQGSDGRPSLFPFFRYVCIRPFLPLFINMATAITGSLPFLKRCASSLMNRRLDVNVLDGTAIAVSLLRRDFRTAGLLTLLLGFGDALERYTHRKSLENLASHLALQVDKVWVRRCGKDELIPYQEIAEGDQVIVRAGTAVPVDGVVMSGTAVVNESSMTGEPLGVMRCTGSSVYAAPSWRQGRSSCARRASASIRACSRSSAS